MTIEELVSGDPAAERQLRALRWVARAYRALCPLIADCQCQACAPSAELDAADAAARGKA